MILTALLALLAGFTVAVLACLLIATTTTTEVDRAALVATTAVLAPLIGVFIL